MFLGTTLSTLLLLLLPIFESKGYASHREWFRPSTRSFDRPAAIIASQKLRIDANNWMGAMRPLTH